MPWRLGGKQPSPTQAPARSKSRASCAGTGLRALRPFSLSPSLFFVSLSPSLLPIAALGELNKPRNPQHLKRSTQRSLQTQRSRQSQGSRQDEIKHDEPLHSACDSGIRFCRGGREFSAARLERGARPISRSLRLARMRHSS
jgi:hypothetical protein